jgi:hypothetical protein
VPHDVVVHIRHHDFTLPALDLQQLLPSKKATRTLQPLEIHLFDHELLFTKREAPPALELELFVANVSLPLGALLQHFSQLVIVMKVWDFFGRVPSLGPISAHIPRSFGRYCRIVDRMRVSNKSRGTFGESARGRFALFSARAFEIGRAGQVVLPSCC